MIRGRKHTDGEFLNAHLCLFNPRAKVSAHERHLGGGAHSTASYRHTSGLTTKRNAVMWSLEYLVKRLSHHTAFNVSHLYSGRKVAPSGWKVGLNGGRTHIEKRDIEKSLSNIPSSFRCRSQFIEFRTLLQMLYVYIYIYRQSRMAIQAPGEGGENVCTVEKRLYIANTKIQTSFQGRRGQTFYDVYR